MGIKTKILELRKSLNLSQEDFAEKLIVTRQAVSRWENGDTIPNIDTLKLIAEKFHISIDDLLFNPSGICQSCGMTLEKNQDKGTEFDGQKSEEFCAYCYQEGKFTQDLTMEELIEHNIRTLNEWNKSSGLNLSEQEARRGLMEFLPTLKRWK